MSSSANKKKRVRVWTPEDRAAHRVFEKSRREAFNDSLIELARQIPSLAGTRRLNKHMIVEHSISRLQVQRQLCVSAIQDVQALLAERDELLAEVNQWRSATGAPLPPREAKPIGQHVRELVAVEKETFGSFPNGFGDNAPEEGSGDDCYHEELGPDSTANAGAPAVPSMRMPHHDTIVPVDSHQPLISPRDGIPGILKLPPSVGVPNTNSFTAEDLLNLHESFDLHDLLDQDIHTGIISNPPIAMATGQGLLGFDGPMTESLQDGVHNSLEHQLSFENGMPTAHAMFGSFNQIDQPYSHETINHQQVFPT